VTWRSTPKHKQIFIEYDVKVDGLTWRDSREPKSSRASLEIPDPELIEQLSVWSKTVVEFQVMHSPLEEEDYWVTPMLRPTGLILNIDLRKEPRKGRS
jgi:hypothetical protein